MTDELKQEVFEYLNELRESDIANMFGAAPYIQKEFDLHIRESRKILAEWMDQY